MNRIIGVTDLQRSFRSIFDQVAEEGQAYILTRGSRPQAALIPYAEFLRYQQLQEAEVLARFDRLRARLSRENATFEESEIQADLRAADQELAGRG